MGPLEGIRIVELAGIGPGPFCAMLLADMGAEVLRVERPAADAHPWPPVLTRGRRSVAVDLKHPQGPEVVRRLAGVADVLLEGFRPGVAERLGVGAPFYDVYEAADGGHLAVGALEPEFYRELLSLLGLDGQDDLPAQYDRERWPELRERIAAAIRGRGRDEWAVLAEGRDACLT